MLKHLPNALTVLRLLLIGPILLLLYHAEYQYAFLVFFIAGLTDGLDGWLARRFQWQSELGSILDPLSDKLIIACSFVALALIGSLPWWLVILVFSRDLTICFGVLFWYCLVQSPIDFKPSIISKFNTVMQISLIALCVFELAFFKLPNIIMYCWILVTTITTAISYVDYVWTWGCKAKDSLKSSNYE